MFAPQSLKICKVGEGLLVAINRNAEQRALAVGSVADFGNWNFLKVGSDDRVSRQVGFHFKGGSVKKYGPEIDAALSSDGRISRKDVRRWIAGAADIVTLSKLYRLTGERYYSIEPELGRDETCSLIQRYLLECIRLDVKDREDVQGRWEAAQTLHGWFCSLAEKEGTDPVLGRAAQAITEAFLNGDSGIRNAIETGFLEHALETPSLRPYFEHWSHEPRLREAWTRAIEWGKAHPDFVWGMLKQLKNIQS